MKESEAPEKIYITPNFERRWFTKEIDDVSVEYTRTDALVKQMKAWLMDNSANYMMYDPLTSSACLEVEKMIEDFKKYMKGE